MKKLIFVGAALFFSITSFSQNRVTLIESYISSTSPDCLLGNQNLDSLVSAPQNDGEFVSIKYPMYSIISPGNGDPYYTLEGGERRNIYAVGGVPKTRLDGIYQVQSTDLIQNELDSMNAILPRVLINAQYGVNVATQTVKVNVEVTVLDGPDTGIRLFIAVFENVSENNVENNGETSFMHIMKKMLPDASGKVMPPMFPNDVFTWTEEYTFNGSYRLPQSSLDYIDHTIEHSVEEFSDLAVAVWVQKLGDPFGTSEVYQAAYAEPGLVVSQKELGNSIVSAQVYPNPANDEAVITIQTTEHQDITLEVLNALGQVVSTQVIENVKVGKTTHSLDLLNLSSGLYTVRIRSEKGLFSKRLVIE